MQTLLTEENFDMPVSESQADRLINSLNKLVEAMGKQETKVAPNNTRLHEIIGGGAIAALLFLFPWVFLHMPGPADVQVAITNGLNPVDKRLTESTIKYPV